MSARDSMFSDLRESRPPMPWTRFDEGDRVGWDASWRLWKSYLLPYRTGELLGIDEENAEMILGPWQWHAPDLVRFFRER